MLGLKFRKIGNIIVMCVTLVTSLINRKRLLSVYQTISAVDLKLTLLGQKQEVCRSNKQNRRNLIVLVAAVDMFYYTVGNWFLLRTKESNFAVEFIANVFPLLVIADFNVSFYGITIALQDRFRIINNRIVKMTQRIEDASFCKSVEELIAIHQNLTKSSKDVNSVFSLHLLLWIGLTFMVSVLAFYVTVWLIVMNLILKHPRIMMNSIKNITINFFDLFCFCHRSVQLCHEANNTKNLLLGVQLKVEAEDERNVIIASVLRLMRHKLKITALRLFTLDRALLFSVNLFILSSNQNRRFFLFVCYDSIRLVRLDKCSSHRKFGNQKALLLLRITSIILGIYPFKF
ncbi:unnamed protein product [Tenebrio molitor]|nr:unnamed protein product [Tenebrio molitor]